MRPKQHILEVNGNTKVVFLTTKPPALCLYIAFGAKDLSTPNFDYGKFGLDIKSNRDTLCLVYSTLDRLQTLSISIFLVFLRLRG